MYFLSYPPNSLPFGKIRLLFIAVLVVSGVNLINPETGLALASKAWSFTGTGYTVHEIIVPDDGYLDFQIKYDDGQPLDDIKFQFSVASCFENKNINIQPRVLYKTNFPAHGKYFDVNIPTGPGKVEIVIHDVSREDTSFYHLTVHYSEPLAWGKDAEPNYPFDFPAKLGILHPPVAIPSLTNFYTCPPEIGEIPIGEGGDDQSDGKDYFQFKVAETGLYDLTYRRLESGGGDCETIASLKNNTDYLYYKWYLKEKDAIGSFLLSKDQTYFIDVQSVFGVNYSFPHYCYASLELGLIPSDSPWLGIENIQHEETAICSIYETLYEEYTAVIQNDGNMYSKAMVRLELFNSEIQKIVPYVEEKYMIIPAGGKVGVKYEILFQPVDLLFTGNWIFQLSVYSIPSHQLLARKKTPIGILCGRPNIGAIFLLLLRS